MMPGDDFGSRLSQGLKRWAEASQPTLDLEAVVRARTGEVQPDQVADARPTALKRYRRWLISAAVATLLLAGGMATFPKWAGATAGWPLVGPVVTKIILEDAGLRWAYTNNLIQGTLAEVREGDIDIRVLGIMADAGRTTVIYQVTGLQEPGNPKPTPAGARSLWDEPEPPEVGLSISKVNGEGALSWQSFNWTSVGLVGTISSLPLPTEHATLELKARIGGRETTLNVEASRAEAGKYSREVPVDQSQTIGDVTVRVQSVIYTPAETVVKYQIQKPEFSGSYGWSNWEGSTYLEAAGKRYHSKQSIGAGEGYIEAFPAVTGTARFVVPLVVKGADADLNWPLTPGATQQAAGATITLTNWEQRGSQITVEWLSEGGTTLKGWDELSVIDAAGKSYPLRHESRGGYSYLSEGIRRESLLDLPAGVEPVAIQAKRLGVRADGPWSFTLPR